MCIRDRNYSDDRPSGCGFVQKTAIRTRKQLFFKSLIINSLQNRTFVEEDPVTMMAVDGMRVRVLPKQ